MYFDPKTHILVYITLIHHIKNKKPNTNNLDLKKSEKAQPGFESMMKFCWEEQDRIMKLNLEDPQHSAMSMFGKH